MRPILDQMDWTRALEEDPKLKRLAVKAGLENDYKRAQELNGCIACNEGKDVIRNKYEKKLAIHLFARTDAKVRRSMNA